MAVQVSSLKFFGRYSNSKFDLLGLCLLEWYWFAFLLPVGHVGVMHSFVDEFACEAKQHLIVLKIEVLLGEDFAFFNYLPVTQFDWNDDVVSVSVSQHKVHSHRWLQHHYWQSFKAHHFLRFFNWRWRLVHLHLYLLRWQVLHLQVKETLIRQFEQEMTYLIIISQNGSFLRLGFENHITPKPPNPKTPLSVWVCMNWIISKKI